MRVRLSALLATLALLALSACAPALEPQQAQPSATPEASMPATPGTPQPGGSTTNLFGPVQEGLIKQYNLSPDQIQVESIQPVEWRDACLGVSNPGEMCAQVITPGFLIMVNTPGGRLEIHTDRSGARYRILEAGKTSPTPTGAAVPAVDWQRKGSNGACQKLSILANGSYSLVNCRADTPSAAPLEGQLSGQDLRAVTTLLRQFSPFSADLTTQSPSGETFSDSFTLYGTGSGVAGETEKEAVHRLLQEIASHIVANPADGGDAGGGVAVPSSGVQVQALIGPNCPGPQSATNPCPDKPYQATFSVLMESNAPVTQFQTDDQGRFTLNLPPGKYILHAETTGRYPTASDQPFTVEPDKYTPLEVHFDTGIR